MRKQAYEVDCGAVSVLLVVSSGVYVHPKPPPAARGRTYVGGGLESLRSEQPGLERCICVCVRIAQDPLRGGDNGPVECHCLLNSSSLYHALSLSCVALSFRLRLSLSFVVFDETRSPKYLQVGRKGGPQICFVGLRSRFGGFGGGPSCLERCICITRPKP